MTSNCKVCNWKDVSVRWGGLERDLIGALSLGSEPMGPRAAPWLAAAVLGCLPGILQNTASRAGPGQMHESPGTVHCSCPALGTLNQGRWERGLSIRCKEQQHAGYHICNLTTEGKLQHCWKCFWLSSLGPTPQRSIHSYIFPFPFTGNWQAFGFSNFCTNFAFL